AGDGGRQSGPPTAPVYMATAVFVQGGDREVECRTAGVEQRVGRPVRHMAANATVSCSRGSRRPLSVPKLGTE
ncbi:hypothetical protein, partial [Streptomyces sp. Tue6028]|uniref:hypothetical protein n=1 Tax=Streptomyces sp. Tue6028 TaxID=2036037 RepID=UPI003D71D457